MQSLFKKDYSKLTTPFFLFDVDHLTEQIAIIKSAFRLYWNNYFLSYSVKTNSLPFLSQIMLQKGVGAEVVSSDEYNLVKTLGYKGSKIICNGPIKTKSWVDVILNDHAYINIDSKSEVQFVCEYAYNHPNEKIKTGIRVNNDIEDLFPGSSTAGRDGSRFGFSYENGDLQSVITQLNSLSNIIISGLLLHISTHLRSLDIYKYIVNKFDKIVRNLHLINIEYLDVGGGFYGELPYKPQLDDYIRTIAISLTEKGYSPNSLKIIIEPGVSLLAGCFSYFTKVFDIKDTLRTRFVVLDGSRIHIDPLMHKTIKDYFYDIWQQNETPIFESSQTLVGDTCLEYDTFFKLYHYNELRPGNLIKFDKVGAYTITLSPLFITWFPTVYFIKKGHFGIARKRWSTQEILQESNIRIL